MHLLLFGGSVEDNSYGEKVIDALETALLLFHLLIDAVDAFCTAFDVEYKTSLFQLFLHGLNEAVDIGVACCFRRIELILYHVIGIVFQIFQRQILKFALQSVETQFVSQGGIEVTCFFCYPVSCLLGFGVANLTHHVNPISDHYQDHPHVFGKANKQIAEVFALYDWALSIELFNTDQPFDNCGNTFPKFLFNVIYGVCIVVHSFIKHDGNNAVTF